MRCFRIGLGDGLTVEPGIPTRDVLRPHAGDMPVVWVGLRAVPVSARPTNERIEYAEVEWVTPPVLRPARPDDPGAIVLIDPGKPFKIEKTRKIFTKAVGVGPVSISLRIEIERKNGAAIIEADRIDESHFVAALVALEEGAAIRLTIGGTSRLVTCKRGEITVT